MRRRQAWQVQRLAAAEQGAAALAPVVVAKPSEPRPAKAKPAVKRKRKKRPSVAVKRPAAKPVEAAQPDA